MRLTDFARRIRLAGARSHLNLDICTLAGAGAALVVLLLFYALLVAPEAGEVSNTAAIVGALIALSPLLVAWWVERTAGTKILSDFRDFSMAVAWFPLTILAVLMTESKGIIVTVMVLGFLVDPVLLGSRRAAYPVATRIMMTYARGLCGIIGTILVLTFIGKLMAIGDPKNKKTLMQEILSAVLWGYIGKKFFDFIGVTKPIRLGSLVSGTGRPQSSHPRRPVHAAASHAARPDHANRLSPVYTPELLYLMVIFSYRSDLSPLGVKEPEPVIRAAAQKVPVLLHDKVPSVLP